MDRGSGVGTASPWVEEERRACQENGEVWYGGSGRTGGLRVRLEQARMAMVVGESASVMLVMVMVMVMVHTSMKMSIAELMKISGLP